MTLVDAEGDQLAVLDISDIWRPDRERESQQVFGTTGALRAAGGGTASSV